MKARARTLWLDVCSRIGEEINIEHPIVEWLVQYAAELISRYTPREPFGKTARERWKGSKSNRPLACFGECIWYLPAEHQPGCYPTLGEKLKDGVLLGLRPESNEVFVGTPEGVKLARTVRRKPEGLR